MCYTDISQEMISLAKRYGISKLNWERIENLFQFRCNDRFNQKMIEGIRAAFRRRE